MTVMEGIVIIAAMFVALIIVLVIVSRTGQHGKIFIDKDHDTGKTIFTLEVDVDPYEIQNMKNVSFKVVKMEESAE